MHGNWGAALSSLTPVFTFGLGAIVVMMVIWIIGIRLLVRGKILCTFHKNRRKTGGLFKIDPDHNCIWVKSKGDPHSEKYDVDEDMMEDVDFPAGFPTIFQTTVRSLEYVRFIPSPFHPEKHSSKNSARSNKLITDENVLNAVYHYAERSLGVASTKQSMILVICIAAVLAVSLFGVYTGMKASSATASNTVILRAIEKALGIITTPVIGK